MIHFPSLLILVGLIVIQGFLFPTTYPSNCILSAKDIRVSSVSDFKEEIRRRKLWTLDVRGDIDEIANINSHPVIDLLYSRKNSKFSDLNSRCEDNYKLAIAIEGGGMRGCVAAGMVTALWYLGLDDSVDAVYGSSAGSLVGAYFIAKQLPYKGPEIYYKLLTSAGKQFIDAKSLLRSCGLGILDLRPSSLLSLFTDKIGKPVLNLNYLLNDVVKVLSPLDWETFWQRQLSHKMPLKIVASGLVSKKSVVLSAANGNFRNVDELTECMKASMLLPGVSGLPIYLKEQQIGNLYPRASLSSEIVSEPLLDAQLFEPIPYRSAIQDNFSHILVFRTRADDQKVTKRLSLFEKMILKRYFLKKLQLPDIASWMLNQSHKAIYAEDILFLNQESRRLHPDNSYPKVCCIALPRGTKEVGRLETSKRVILENIRAGFASSFNILNRDPILSGKGAEIAKTIWPDDLIEE